MALAGFYLAVEQKLGRGKREEGVEFSLTLCFGFQFNFEYAFVTRRDIFCSRRISRFDIKSTWEKKANNLREMFSARQIQAYKVFRLNSLDLLIFFTLNNFI